MSDSDGHGCDGQLRGTNKGHSNEPLSRRDASIDGSSTAALLKLRPNR